MDAAAACSPAGLPPPPPRAATRSSRARRRPRPPCGVSMSPTVIPGLLRDVAAADLCVIAVRAVSSALSTKSAPKQASVSSGDAERLLRELAAGIYLDDALPWTSIESTNDRGASRVVSVHPLYRSALAGLVVTELDVALKSVGGTANGGVFCCAVERKRFLDTVCGARDWGPNGQREVPPALGTLAKVAEGWPSFRTSDKLFGNGEVSAWRGAWEAVSSGAETGMDIEGAVAAAAVVSPSCPGAPLVVEVEASWSVKIHASDSDGKAAPSRRALAERIRRDGEALCRRLLPTVPNPAASARQSGGWAAPVGRGKLEYLLACFELIIALSTVLTTMKAETDLVPEALFEDTASPTRPIATARRVPFEPARDEESGAVFLGGGVSIGGRAVRLNRRRGTPADLAAAPSVVVVARRSSPRTEAELARRRAALKPVLSLFAHEVAALGLFGTYRRGHATAQHPSEHRPPLPVAALAALLTELLPDGYNRRLKRAAGDVARTEWKRADVAAAVARVLPSPHCTEDVVLLNGDRFDGGWAYGRRHGEGVYFWKGGGRYVGRWTEGEMVGAGTYYVKHVGGRGKQVDHSDM